MSNWFKSELQKEIKSTHNPLPESTRMSITLDTLDIVRLEYIIDKLGLFGSKQHFIDTAVTAALYEIEMESGLRDEGTKVLHRDMTFAHPMRREYADQIMSRMEQKKAEIIELNERKSKYTQSAGRVSKRTKEDDGEMP